MLKELIKKLKVRNVYISKIKCKSVKKLLLKKNKATGLGFRNLFKSWECLVLRLVCFFMALICSKLLKKPLYKLIWA
jgi:hypothetical protein